MTTQTTGTSFHNRCAVRAVATDPATGWCLDHEAPVYRDGIDWHTDTDRIGVVFVLDASRASARYTGRVTVAGIDGAADAELAEVAGFGTCHQGYVVTRYDDGTALVSLWND